MRQKYYMHSVFHEGPKTTMKERVLVLARTLARPRSLPLCNPTEMCLRGLASSSRTTARLRGVFEASFRAVRVASRIGARGVAAAISRQKALLIRRVISAISWRCD